MGTLLEKRTSSEAHQFRSAPVQMRTRYARHFRNTHQFHVTSAYLSSKHMKAPTLFLLAIITLVSCTHEPKEETIQDWQIGPFVKVDSVNPILWATGD
jgi:hypothetical protein